MSDIVTTLRSGELCGEDRCRVMNAEGGCTCAVAAAEIERLRAENKRLTEENERLDAEIYPLYYAQSMADRYD